MRAAAAERDRLARLVARQCERHIQMSAWKHAQPKLQAPQSAGGILSRFGGEKPRASVPALYDQLQGGRGSFSAACARCKRLSSLYIPSCRASNEAGASKSEEIPQPKHSKPLPRVEESSLPLLQRCKNLLAANWRAQLTTININSDDPHASKLHGTLVSYVLVSGKPILWFPKNGAHEMNLLMDERGSMVVGHTDPPALVRAWREVGHVPPRTMLLGSMAPLQRHEKEYVRRRVLKARDATNEALKEAGTALQTVLQESGRLLSSRVQALSAMAEASDDDFSVYRLKPKACHFVDLLGGRHEVEVDDIAGAAVDPLSKVLVALIEGINQSETRRFALIVFCAVYLQVRVQDAYIFAADRWGFNVLAKVGSSEDPEPANATEATRANKHWREFRFAFSRDVKDAEGFCVLLAEMERESLEALKNAQQVDPDFLKHKNPRQ